MSACFQYIALQFNGDFHSSYFLSFLPFFSLSSFLSSYLSFLLSFLFLRGERERANEWGGERKREGDKESMKLDDWNLAERGGGGNDQSM